MPEMTFTVRWPDGSVEECYSPSLVMHDHLDVGADYSLGDFLQRATSALDSASQRVRAKYGFECTSAMAQKERLTERSVGFDPASPVRILTMVPSLPAEG